MGVYVYCIAEVDRGIVWIFLKCDPSREKGSLRLTYMYLAFFFLKKGAANSRLKQKFLISISRLCGVDGGFFRHPGGMGTILVSQSINYAHIFSRILARNWVVNQVAFSTFIYCSPVYGNNTMQVWNYMLVSLLNTYDSCICLFKTSLLMQCKKSWIWERSKKGC